MALANYQIEYDDGTIDYLQLDEDGKKQWNEIASDKGSPVKNVKKGDPKPINAGGGS